MGFQYSLQKVVDLKANEKTQAEWMLSRAIGQLQNEELTLNQLSDERDRLVEVLFAASQNCTSISQLQLAQDYLAYFDQQITNKNRDVQKAQTNVNYKQESLTHKMLDEKVWTKAKEKAYHKFVAITAKKEQDNLDELATMRHGIHPG